MNGARNATQSFFNWLLYITTGLIIAVFLLGGGARADVWSLVLLRPIVAVTLVALMVLLGRRAFADVPGPFLLLWLTVLLVLFHLVPLPPAIWVHLPGRSKVAEMMLALGVTPGWMPISLSPIDGWNQFFSLMVPAAILYAIVGLGRAGAPIVLKLLLVLIFVSAILGLLQAIGPSGSWLYFYRITNEGESVGLFANRNHQAMLLACGFPLIALYASTIRGSAESIRAKLAMALCGALTLLPLLLVTGSRAGVALGVIGMVAGSILYRRTSSELRHRMGFTKRFMWPVMGIGAFVLAGFAAVMGGRTTGWERITDGDAVDDLRFQALPHIVKAAWSYFPFGSGAGSFVPVFKLLEPDQMISASYFNHAHNDLIEILLEFGLPGLLLIMMAVLGWAWSVQRLWRLNQAANGKMKSIEQFGWAGAAVLLLLGVGSIFDYPLRTPSLAALGAIAAVWLAWAASPTKSSDVDKSQEYNGQRNANRLRASNNLEV